MEVVITRNMTVADGGVSRQFTKAVPDPETGELPTESVSADVAHRLFRAGAAFKASLKDGQVTSDASKDPNAGNVFKGNGNADNGGNGNANGLPENFESMTKAELVAFAGTLTPPVELGSSDTKDEIKAKIRERFPA